MSHHRNENGHGSRYPQAIPLLRHSNWTGSLPVTFTDRPRAADLYQVPAMASYQARVQAQAQAHGPAQAQARPASRSVIGHGQPACFYPPAGIILPAHVTRTTELPAPIAEARARARARAVGAPAGRSIGEDPFWTQTQAVDSALDSVHLHRARNLEAGPGEKLSHQAYRRLQFSLNSAREKTENGTVARQSERSECS